MKKMYPFFAIASLFLLGCSSHSPKNELPVITDLNQLSVLKRAIYKLPSGKEIEMHFEASTEYDIVDDDSLLNSSKSLVMASDNKYCDAPGCPENCNFDGTRRYEAKTTISKGETKTYNNVTDFLTRFADKYPDADMPDVINGSDGRVPLEDFNATITKAYLFCYAKETDEDYHLVIGTLKNADDPKNRFMIVEISGVPEESGGDKTIIKKAQNDFFKIVGEKVCTGGYLWYPVNDGIPITVTGSIYWDTEHWSKKNQTIGKHGPEYLSDRLTTVWEIHPITYIKAL